MDMLARYEKLFKYDEWANREVTGGLRQASTVPARSLKLLAHILGTEYLWFYRLKKEKSAVAVWPEFSVMECERHCGLLAQTWSGYLTGLEARGLSATVEYKNTQGELWSSAVEDILTHVIMHSAYHRGQIASDMRNSGLLPVYTDFIHAVRQGLVK
ncbi:MAG TPA: DinB family protein [Terriglobales bacterium]|nr:DinB family protein [Terriglobales bacterium]